MLFLTLFIIGLLITALGLSFLAAAGWGWVGFIFSFVVKDVTDWGSVGRRFGIKKNEKNKFITLGLIIVGVGLAILYYAFSSII